MVKSLWSPGQLLPQADPMILLNEIVGYADDRLTARVVVRPTDMFFERERGIAAHCAIEWMAQACGAFIGAEALSGRREVQTGLLLGTRDFRAEVYWFRDGDVLDVVVKPSFRDQGMAVFDCVVQRPPDAMLVAHAQLTVYQPPDVARLIADQIAEARS